MSTATKNPTALQTALDKIAKLEAKLQSINQGFVAQAATGLRIETYSTYRPDEPKSFAVRGTTPDHAEDMKSFGGGYNRQLKGGAAWIFPEYDRDEVPMRDIIQDWIVEQTLGV